MPLFGSGARSRSVGSRKQSDGPHATHSHYRSDSQRSRGSSRSRTPSPWPPPGKPTQSAAGIAACAVACIVLLAYGSQERRGAPALRRREARGFHLFIDDGAVGEDPRGEEQVNAETWASLLQAPVRCKSALGRQCEDPPPTPPPVEHIPGVRQTPAPQAPDLRPRLCCDRDYEAPCPAGWRIVGRPGYRVASVPWRWRGSCSRLVPRSLGEVTAYTRSEDVRCAPPAGYDGPCGEDAPPCDPHARRGWAERCNATWPCAKEVLLCEWQLCSPKCHWGSTEPIRGGSCAVDPIVQPLHIVTPFPSLDVAKTLTPERRLEYVNALRCNVAHPHVARVHLLVEPSPEEAVVRGALAEAGSQAEKLKVLFKLWKSSGVLNQESFGRWKDEVLSGGNITSMRNSTLSLDERLDNFVFGGPRPTGICAPMQDRCGKVRVQQLSQTLFYSDVLRYVSERPSLHGKYVLIARADQSVSSGFKGLMQMTRQVPAGTVATLTPYDDVSCYAIDSRAAAEGEEDDDGACDCRTSSGDCGNRAYLFRAPLPPEVAQASLTPLPNPESRGQVISLENGHLQWAGVHVDADLPLSGRPGADAIFLEVLRHHGLRVDNRCGAFVVRRHRCHAAVTQKGARQVNLQLLRRPVGPFPPPAVHVRLARWWYKHNTSWPLHVWRHAPPRVEGKRTLSVAWEHSEGLWYAAARPRTVPADA
eukprot:TRINITY_DN9337_c0_g3_i1.p1 TRINITY_DN9337_c0_g3~~TRINITY_DN9337_c0_g3_i1.p1  ORF type:complete len:702 (+),score=146.38 TRINITY_DN9337_c0_g3_i1:77-2182(+)